jgi:hypothetical protein
MAALFKRWPRFQYFEKVGAGETAMILKTLPNTALQGTLRNKAAQRP